MFFLFKKNSIQVLCDNSKTMKRVPIGNRYRIVFGIEFSALIELFKDGKSFERTSNLKRMGKWARVIKSDRMASIVGNEVKLERIIYSVLRISCLVYVCSSHRSDQAARRSHCCKMHHLRLRNSLNCFRIVIFDWKGIERETIVYIVCSYAW